MWGGIGVLKRRVPERGVPERGGAGRRDAGVQGTRGQAVAVGSTGGSPRTPHLKKSWDSKVLSAGRHLGMGFSRVECKVCWKLERTSAETEIQSDS